jgi:hypothetical protein
MGPNVRMRCLVAAFDLTGQLHGLFHHSGKLCEKCLEARYIPDWQRRRGIVFGVGARKILVVWELVQREKCILRGSRLLFVALRYFLMESLSEYKGFLSSQPRERILQHHNVPTLSPYLYLVSPS